MLLRAVATVGFALLTALAGGPVGFWPLPGISAPVGAYGETPPTGWLTEPPMDLSQGGVPAPQAEGPGAAGAPAGSGGGTAQPAPGGSPSAGSGPTGGQAAAAPPPAVEEVKPEQIYLRDADGSLKLMLGWTMAQFEELVRLRDALEQRTRPPLFTLEELTVRGKALDRYAELTVGCKVRLLGGTPVRIPLGLEQLILKEPPRRSNGQPLMVTYSRKEGGYFLFLQGTKDSVEEITLGAWAPLAESGEDRRLVLSAPEAPTSLLELDLPADNVTISVSPGATVLGVENAPGQGRRVRVAGLGPGFELAWHAEAPPEKETPPALECVSLVLIRAASGGMDFDARLTIRSYTTPFDRVRVRLPPEAALLPSTATGYSITPVREGGSAENRANGVVEVSFPKKLTGPAEVRLLARRAVKGEDWIELAGFSVEGAVRQWGYVGLTVAADQTVQWGNLSGVRQIEKFPAAAETNEPPAGFEYYAVPYSLPVRLLSRPSSIAVKPQYRVDFTASALVLQGNLACEVRGAEISALQLDLAGWEISEATLAGQTQPLAVLRENSRTTLVLPQRTAGKIEITLKARRPTPSPGTPFQMAFPQLVGAQADPAEVVFVVAPNVDFRPDLEKSPGLASGAASALGTDGPNVLAWRLKTPDAVLVGRWSARSRQMSAEMETRVTVEGPQAAVEQRIRVSVAYEPWGEPWHLLVPAEIEGTVSAFLDGRPVELRAVEGSTDAVADAPGAAQVREYTVTPLTPVLGNADLVLRFAVGFPGNSVQTVRWRVPLIRWRDGQVARHRLVVVLPQGWDVEAVGQPWSLKSPLQASESPPSQIECEVGQPVGEVAFNLKPQELVGTQTVVVEKFLLQTRLDRNMRQDRCVIAFQTLRPSITLRIPWAGRGDAAQIWLDGRAVQARTTGRSEVVIPLTADAGARNQSGPVTRYLEIWYELPRFRGDWGRTRLELPQIDEPVLLRRMYWEIVLLPDEHIVWTASPVSLEYRWGWTGQFWGRVPALSESELERWAGVPEGWMNVSIPANRYLFGSLRSVAAVDIWTLRRPWIVALCSGSVVLLGWGWLYLAWRWKRLLAIGVVGLLMLFGLLRPDLAVLAAEAGALGVALAVLSWFLYRSVSSPEPARVAASGWGERTTMETVVCRRNPEAAACPPAPAESATHSHV